MGRPPIHKKPMTDTQRQRRHRAKVKRKLIALGTAEDKKKRRQRRMAKIGERVVPMPPGITYWRQITVTTPDGEQQVWAPITQPAPGAALLELSDAEIASLIENLEHEQKRRAGTRPTSGGLEQAAFQVMLASRPHHYLHKLEMFARNPRAGWDIWGADVCISLGLM
jgi:hypothetical protein